VTSFPQREKILIAEKKKEKEEGKCATAWRAKKEGGKEGKKKASSSHFKQRQRKGEKSGRKGAVRSITTKEGKKEREARGKARKKRITKGKGKRHSLAASRIDRERGEGSCLSPVLVKKKAKGESPSIITKEA